MRIIYIVFLCSISLQLFGQDPSDYTKLMQQARARASAHGSSAHPAVSDGNDAILSGVVPVEMLHRSGFKVIGGISDDPDILRRLIRKGIDGYITDRPDVLIGVLHEEISTTTDRVEKVRLKHFDVEAHRGGRGLRPESTLPSFENGLDLGATTLEMDTGVSADNVSMIWHDEYYDPAMCRRIDGRAYDSQNRFWIRDKKASDIQNELICDKTPFDTAQLNMLSISPVSVAFAKKTHCQVRIPRSQLVKSLTSCVSTVLITDLVQAETIFLRKNGQLKLNACDSILRQSSFLTSCRMTMERCNGR